MIIIHPGSHFSQHIRLLPRRSTVTSFVIFQFPFKRFPLHLYTYFTCIWRNRERARLGSGGIAKDRWKNREREKERFKAEACQESHLWFHWCLHNSESLGSVLHFRRHQATWRRRRVVGTSPFLARSDLSVQQEARRRPPAIRGFLSQQIQSKGSVGAEHF